MFAHYLDAPKKLVRRTIKTGTDTLLKFIWKRSLLCSEARPVSLGIAGFCKLSIIVVELPVGQSHRIRKARSQFIAVSHAK